MKIKITISYDGTPFNGSQIQPNFPTIQSKLQEVLSTLKVPLRPWVKKPESI